MGVGLLFAEQAFTNIEAFWLGNIFNYMEHSSALIGSIVMTLACIISYKHLEDKC